MWILCSVSDLKPRKDGKQKATWDTCNPSCFPQESNTCYYLKNFCGQLIKSKHKTPQNKTEYIKYLYLNAFKLHYLVLALLQIIQQKCYLNINTLINFPPRYET